MEKLLNNFKTRIALTLFFLLLPVYSFAESVESRIQSGVSHYKQQEYDEAARLFLESQVDQPDDAALSYNLANSNYKLGNYAEAIQGYSRAAAGSPDTSLRQRAIYNIGNSFFRLDKLEEAAAAYKKSLELDPNDMDAKFNLEFAREQIKKRKQRQNQDSSQNKKPDAGGQNKESPQGQDQNREQKQNDSQEDSRSADSSRGNQEKRSERQNAQQPPAHAQAVPDKSAMSKEEAEQWLRSLQEDPKKFSRKQMAERPDNQGYKGKDW